MTPFLINRFKAIKKILSGKLRKWNSVTIKRNLVCLERFESLKFSFSEMAKKLLNLPHGFHIHLVSVKAMRKIAQIFVAFSEKLNFANESSILIIDVKNANS